MSITEHATPPIKIKEEDQPETETAASDGFEPAWYMYAGTNEAINAEIWVKYVQDRIVSWEAVPKHPLVESLSQLVLGPF